MAGGDASGNSPHPSSASHVSLVMSSLLQAELMLPVHFLDTSHPAFRVPEET